MSEISGTGSRAKSGAGQSKMRCSKLQQPDLGAGAKFSHFDAVKRLRKRKRTTSNNSQQKALAFRWAADCSRPRESCSHSLSLSHAMENSSE